MSCLTKKWASCWAHCWTEEHRQASVWFRTNKQLYPVVHSPLAGPSLKHSGLQGDALLRIHLLQATLNFNPSLPINFTSCPLFFSGKRRLGSSTFPPGAIPENTSAIHCLVRGISLGVRALTSSLMGHHLLHLRHFWWTHKKTLTIRRAKLLNHSWLTQVPIWQNSSFVLHKLHD